MDIAAAATGSFGALLVPMRGRIPNFFQSDSVRPVTERYICDGWVHRDERYRAITSAWPQRGVCSEFDFTTPEEIAQSQYYQEFLAPHGLRWFAGVRLGEGEDVWILSLQRSITQGPFSLKELNLLSALSRRLGGVAELACAFGFARVEGALAAFEASKTPAAALDRMGEVVRLNHSAELLLGVDLQIVHKRIVSSDRDATAALDRALYSLLWSKGEAFHRPIVLPRRDARPVLAYPSRITDVVPEGFTACSGFVIFVDLDTRLTADVGLLAKAFGLSAAEARLASGLLGGASLEASALKFGVAKETARNQLKSVFEKTNTHRQAQLVALLARCARVDSP